MHGQGRSITWTAGAAGGVDALTEPTQLPTPSPDDGPGETPTMTLAEFLDGR
jgi:hypothetical protein